MPLRLDLFANKVLFLDIDGVLNSHDWYSRDDRPDGKLGHFDPSLVCRVQEIADRAGAAVVISSAWRQFHPLKVLEQVLCSTGLRAPIVGQTPIIEGGEFDGLVRANEIARWLELNRTEARLHGAKPVQRFVILDDLDDFGALAPWHVCTSFEDGLTSECVERAVALLESA
ncbi:MAG TPA: HAD domain-containing protein [Anaeromyxobacteraceae bacterium]|nr:HAD domain-containing protein [Anaeromyxobacteraceae bacterium]